MHSYVELIKKDLAAPT